jgi:hypothetical protein
VFNKLQDKKYVKFKVFIRLTLVNNVLQAENFTVAALQQIMQMTVMHGFCLYSCGYELNMKAD